MMLLLGLAAVMAGIPPEEAAGKALMSCVKHSAGMLPISAANATPLAVDGLAYQAEPPSILQSMKHTPYGTAEFAGAPASEGQVFAVGYDGGTCIVMVVGTSVEPIERRLAGMFGIPGTWRKEQIAQRDASSRWTQYSWTANSQRLTAQMKVQPLPSTPAKGMVMVTIAPKSEKR